MTPQRIQLRRTKGWRKPPNTVVVARPSKWGNHWRALPTGDGWSVFARTRNGLDWWLERIGIVSKEEAVAECVELYRLSILADVEDLYDDMDAAITDGYFSELRGKNLACWCPLNQPCHADVLLELANATTTPPSLVVDGTAPGSPVSLTAGSQPGVTDEGATP